MSEQKATSSICSATVSLILAVIFASCLLTSVRGAPRLENIEDPDAIRYLLQSRNALNRIKNIDIIRGLLNDIGQPGRVEGGGANIDKRSRPECWINAGMSRGCDYKDLMTAVEEHKYWNTDNTPGKRRRRRSLFETFEPKLVRK